MSEPRTVFIETDDDEWEEPDHGFTINVTQDDDDWWATWLQPGVGAKGDSRTGALRALADLLDEIDTWSPKRDDE
jgi:hypothetical protein